MRTTGKAPIQEPSGMPFQKYVPFWKTNTFVLPDRTWPDRHVTKAPRWLSTDLRDGNQALIDPMDSGRKRKMFDLLVKLGVKEIEIGFPAASQTDYDFVRSLIETEAVPEDICISVLTQARPDLIERTINALKGFPRANVHIYNATAPVFREVVFRNDKPATIDLATRGVSEVMRQAEKQLGDETVFGLEYSPEIFVDTEADFALEICEKVMDVWQPDTDREIILNLPATVERYTPDSYADQVEWMSRNLSRREHVCLSIHNHNDRGSGIGTAELGMKAGADRVEGCLLGEGERTGNVDLLTLALNLFSQGVDPMLKLGNLDEIKAVVEHCTRMPTSPRHPYIGDLVYTSFSGSHQDAIKKGFEARAKAVEKAGGDENAVTWNIPYLPIDPHDVGRDYRAVVRVNSQSGKGGIAFIMKRDYNLDMPRRLQIDFAKVVQSYTDAHGGEVDSELLGKIFTDEYLPATKADKLESWGRFCLFNSRSDSDSDDGEVRLQAEIGDRGKSYTLEASGNGPIDAFTNLLTQRGVEVTILDYSEHAMEAGGKARAAAYVEAEIAGEIYWGVGIDSSITRATYKAVISAVNRSQR